MPTSEAMNSTLFPSLLQARLLQCSRLNSNSTIQVFSFELTENLNYRKLDLYQQIIVCISICVDFEKVGIKGKFVISEFELCGLHFSAILGDTTSIDGWLPPLIVRYSTFMALAFMILWLALSLWDDFFLTFMFIFSLYTVQ